jgi:serine/threonine-protein kinase
MTRSLRPTTASRQRASADRYAIYDEIAAGGMASVHLGRLLGDGGFSRTVAIKRLHPHFGRDPEFVTMLLEEAHMAARVHHPNVAATLDVVHTNTELYLVMEYVHGESLASLIGRANEAGARVPEAVAVAIVTGMLYGLHAAHEATDESGAPMAIVHRDVSPQNVIVGADGIPRVVDFGIAKASGSALTTREGQIKGKLPYMSPEQLRGERSIDRRSDVWSASVVLWEAMTGVRLFKGASDAETFGKVLYDRIAPPSTRREGLSSALDAAVLRGLDRFRECRFPTARAMAIALEQAVHPATPSEVAAWVESLAGNALAARKERLARSTDEEPSTIVTPVTEEARQSDVARRPRRDTVRWIVVGVAALSLAGGVATLRRHETARAGEGLDRSAPLAAETLPPSGRDTLTSASVASEPAASALPVSAPPASAPLPPAPPAPERTPSPRPPPDAKPRARSSSHGARITGDACHTVDGAGIWHINPKCL